MRNNFFAFNIEITQIGQSHRIEDAWIRALWSINWGEIVRHLNPKFVEFVYTLIRHHGVGARTNIIFLIAIRQKIASVIGMSISYIGRELDFVRYKIV